MKTIHLQSFPNGLNHKFVLNIVLVSVAIIVSGYVAKAVRWSFQSFHWKVKCYQIFKSIFPTLHFVNCKLSRGDGQKTVWRTGFITT